MSTEYATSVEIVNARQSYYHQVWASLQLRSRDSVTARTTLGRFFEEPEVTDAMLVHGMLYGLHAAWLHPSADLLWLQCGGRIDLIKELARQIPIYKSIPLSHRTGVGIRHTAHDLLYGLSQALTPEMGYAFPARIFTVAGWLRELSLTEELLCDMAEYRAVQDFFHRWRSVWGVESE